MVLSRRSAAPSMICIPGVPLALRTPLQYVLLRRPKRRSNALSAFVIRHGIDDLPDEQQSFGSRRDWSIVVPPATCDELELMVRMDRSLRVAKEAGLESTKATNDPRFHVGWRYFDTVQKKPEGRRVAPHRTCKGGCGAPAQVHQTTPQKGGDSSFQDGRRRRGGGSNDRMRARRSSCSATITRRLRN